MDAYAQLPADAPPLVLAGEHKWNFADISRQIAERELGQRVHCPGSIADEDLPALYQGALALVYPSRYEGFGLQLVEAMASGVPVLASNTTSLPEVLGGCGLLFDPEDATSIAQPMQQIAGDESLRHSLGEKGRERARFFSWNTAAEQTLRLISSCWAARTKWQRCLPRRSRSKPGEDRHRCSGCAPSLWRHRRALVLRTDH